MQKSPLLTKDQITFINGHIWYETLCPECGGTLIKQVGGNHYHVYTIHRSGTVTFSFNVEPSLCDNCLKNKQKKEKFE